MAVIQSRTRAQIRQVIGRAVGAIFGTATSNGDTTSLLDTYNLRGADDEYNGRYGQMITLNGAASTEKFTVTDFSNATSDATVSPTLTAATKSGDTYELWPYPFQVNDINDQIDLAVMDATRHAYQTKQTTNNFTAESTYEYAWLTSFIGLHTVEYVSRIGIEKVLDECDSAWDESTATGITVTAESNKGLRLHGDTIKIEMADGASTGILCSNDISAIDISDCDYVEFWIYSSITLTAGQLEIALDNTASCASALENLDIPAVTAKTWTRCSVALANAYLDTAIISVGLNMTSDVGAGTVWLERITAVKSTSKVFKPVPPDLWSITRGSTNYVRLSPQAMGFIGYPTQVSLSGYQIPALLTADTSTSEIDPQFIIHWVIGQMCLNHAKSSSLEVNNRVKLGETHLAMAEKIKQQMRPTPLPNTRWI